MSPSDPLHEYRRKRDFARTPEPSGERAPSAPDAPRFVVQKHDASRLHYDFRLEVDDVLKSWAVPKGPSLNPRDKRLAVPTEDHPLDYLDFEGTIPAGEYGAGTVIVWDTGAYRPLKDKPLAESLAEGQAEVWLEGHKLRGGYALVRTQGDGEEEPNWLLIKMKDDEADPHANITEDAPGSVLTGRTLAEVREAGEHE